MSEQIQVKRETVVPGVRRMKELRQVDRELAKWKQLKKDLEEYDSVDVQTMLDMCEGETELFEILTLLAEESRIAELEARGVAMAIEELTTRKKRHETRSTFLKIVIQQALEISEFDTLKAPTVTLSIADGPAPIEVTDETKLPAEYWKRPDPVIDKAKIREAVKELGENDEMIPGVTVGDRPKILRIKMS